MGNKIETKHHEPAVYRIGEQKFVNYIQEKIN